MNSDSTTDAPGVASHALLAVLGDAQAASLTANKTETIQTRDGYRVTGFVLCHPETGARCLVEMSAVRWLSKDESWWLMHTSQSPLDSDGKRLDWLADPDNQIGNVQLPVGAVIENVGSLRDAIDAAMTGNYEHKAALVESGYSPNTGSDAPGATE
jgi:hypothetical protein